MLAAGAQPGLRALCLLVAAGTSVHVEAVSPSSTTTLPTPTLTASASIKPVTSTPTAPLTQSFSFTVYLAWTGELKLVSLAEKVLKVFEWASGPLTQGNVFRAVEVLVEDGAMENATVIYHGAATGTSGRGFQVLDGDAKRFKMRVATNSESAAEHANNNMDLMVVGLDAAAHSQEAMPDGPGVGWLLVSSLGAGCIVTAVGVGAALMGRKKEVVPVPQQPLANEMVAQQMLNQQGLYQQHQPQFQQYAGIERA